MYALSKNTEIKNNTILTNQIVSNNENHYQSTENDHLSIIESGENKIAFEKILNAIQSAEKVICLQSFLIQDSKIIDLLIEKVKYENVKIYVLSSANTRLENVENNDDFIISDYINLLENKFKNNFIFRSSEKFHAKYLLIDPETKNSKGFLCTNNFTKKGFTKNIELTLSLNSKQCKELFRVFVYHFWEHASHEQNETQTFEFVKPQKHFTLPNLQHLLLTSPNKNYSNLGKTLLELISSAKKSVCISTYTFEINQKIVELLIEKSKQNIDITFFCHPKHTKIEEYKKLSENGISVILHENFHAKSLVIDDKTGFLFTGNLDHYSMNENLEIGILLNENQTSNLVAIHNHWKQNLSYRIMRKISIQNINHTIELSKNGFKKNKIKNIETVEISVEPKTVNDLISSFNQNNFKTNNKNKFTIFNISAKIKEIKIKNLTFSTDFFYIIEEKNNQSIVINDNFTTDLIFKLEKYKNHNLFYSAK